MGRIADYRTADPIFRATGEPSGFIDRVATLSFVPGPLGATREFTITGDHDIYISGVLYSKTTDTIQITDVTGTHWIYYDATGTLSVATSAPAFNLPLIATIYWNTTTDNYLLGDERHGIVMDWHTHTLMHYTAGTRYETGLTGAFITGSFSVGTGRIDDEDLVHELLAPVTQCNVIYKNGSANFEWDGPQATYYKLNAGTLRYNNGNALANVPLGSYVAYWVFMTNDITTPIISMMGQRVDANITDARNNNKYESLAFGQLPYQEAKVIYRVLLRNIGGVATYIEAQDLRVVSNLPAGTYVATAHNVLTGLEWSLSGHNDINFNVNANADGRIGIGLAAPAYLVDILSADTTASGRVLNISHSGSVTGSHTGINYTGTSVCSVEQIGQSITLTGASATNTAGYFSASGGTINNALLLSTGGTTANDYYINCAVANNYWKASGTLRTSLSIYTSYLYAYAYLWALQVGIGINPPGLLNELDVLQTSTTANSVGVNILHSGLVAGGASTVYSQKSSVTGANGLNVAGWFSATGATANWALETIGLFAQKDGATYYGILDFTSSVALGANRTLTVDLLNGDRTLKFGNAHILDADAGTIVAQFNTLLSELETAGILLSA